MSKIRENVVLYADNDPYEVEMYFSLLYRDLQRLKKKRFYQKLEKYLEKLESEEKPYVQNAQEDLLESTAYCIEPLGLFGRAEAKARNEARERQVLERLKK